MPETTGAGDRSQGASRTAGAIDELICTVPIGSVLPRNLGTVQGADVLCRHDRGPRNVGRVTVRYV